MRIAQVAPLAEAVPPGLYGGTERVVSWLTEELVRQGHQVTLFASGDSKTAANLVPSVPRGLRLAGIRDHTASTRSCSMKFIVVQTNSTLSIFISTFYNFPYFRTFSKNA
jgi:Glycosyltransferase Family 4